MDRVTYLPVKIHKIHCTAIHKTIESPLGVAHCASGAYISIWQYSATWSEGMGSDVEIGTLLIITIRLVPKHFDIRSQNLHTEPLERVPCLRFALIQYFVMFLKPH